MKWHKAKAKHLRLGRKGERLAVRLVKEFGLELLCCNFRISGGEIDIVALDDDTICFIEVKTRQNKGSLFLDRPADAVGFYKKKRLRKAARNYLYRINNPQLNIRFDVIEMIFRGTRLQSAYWLPEYFSMSSDVDYDYGFEFE